MMPLERRGFEFHLLRQKEIFKLCLLQLIIFSSASPDFNTIFIHIYAAVRLKNNAFRFKKFPLNTFATKGKPRRNPALAVYHSVTRNYSRLGIYVKSIAHNPCPPRISCKKRHLSVSCNLSFGDGFNNRIYLFKCVHTLTFSYTYVFQFFAAHFPIGTNFFKLGIKGL